MKNCIMCRNPKEVFTDEHVIPAAIGGAFVIRNVCNECNEKLGVNIDDPFVRSPRMALNRHQFKIRRTGKLGNRKIPNPLRGRHKDKNGDEHVVIFDDEGRPRTKMVPKLDASELTKDGIGKITLRMAKEDFTSEEDLIRRISKKLGIKVDPDRVEYEERTSSEPITIGVKTPNEPLILGALKIAYEYAVTFVPEYLSDPDSKEFAQILLSKTINSEQAKFFDEDLNLRIQLVNNKLRAIKGLAKHHHIVLISSIKNKGLVCLVKLFDFVYLIKLTDNLDSQLKNDLMIINDAVMQTYQINVPAILSEFTLSTEMNRLERKQRRAIQRQEKRAFNNTNNEIPVFDRNGNQIYPHLAEFAYSSKVLYCRYDHKAKRSTMKIEIEKDRYYLKSYKTSLLVPILDLTCHYDLQY